MTLERKETVFHLMNENVEPPRRATKGSVGYDLRTYKDLVINPKEYVVVHTGVRVSFAESVYGMLYIRSSMAKLELMLLNSVGIIDNDYRGEIQGIIYNTSPIDTVSIIAGTSMLQLVLYNSVIIENEDNYTYDDIDTNTERGEGGFGSTDNKTFH